MMKTFGLMLIALALMCGLTTPSAYAQEQNAQIDGSVLDSTGATVPEAVVVVKNASRGISETTKTNAQGEFVLPQLPPGGGYSVSASRVGFNKSVRTDINLDVAQTLNLTLTLSAGSTTETITVSTSDLALDTQTSSLGQVIPGQQVEDLPLNGRSTFRLIQLVPGVTFSDSANGQFGDVPGNTTFDSNFSINGGRAQSNAYLIDGVPTDAGFFNQITTIPIVDETQQFKVETSNLSAAYGRFAGGVINVSTRSGTDAIHGDVFEFARNAIFDANTWFNDNLGKPKPDFNLNQFGGTLGAPVVIPHLYNGRDKTFFFLSYQGSRRLQGDPVFLNVPTHAEKQGDFTAVTTGTIYNPFSYNAATNSRAQFATHNVIPQSMIDPVAFYIANTYFPDPNVPTAIGTTNNYFNQADSHLSQNVYGVRIDQRVGPRYHLFGRYEYSGTEVTQPNETGTIADVTGAVGTTALNNQSFALGNTITLSPSLLLSINYGFARWYQFRKTLSYGFNVGSFGTPGWQALESNVVIPVFPAITINNFLGTNQQGYLKNANDSHTVSAQLIKVAGRQEIVVGVDARLHRINFYNINDSTGSFTFNPQATRINDTAPTQGLSFASFMLGVGASGQWDTEQGNALEDYYGAVYAQDNIRLTSKLTLNVGIRYDGESPFTDRHNRLNFFDPNIPSAAADTAYPALKGGLVFAGTGNIGKDVYKRDHADIVPRIGFAFAPNTNMVVRASFGMNYAPLELTNNAVGTVPNAGFAAATTWNPTTSVPGGASTVPLNLFQNPFPNGLLPITGSSLGTATELGQTISVWEHNAPTPYSEQYVLDMQFMLPKGVLLDMAYVGSEGVHLTETFNHNTLSFADERQLGTTFLQTAVPNPFASQVPYGTLSNATINQRQLLLPYPQFQNVNEVNNPFGHSSYNAGQVKVEKQVNRGLRLLSGMTWSKTMSNVNSQTAPIGIAPSSVVQDYGNLAGERSLSDLDIKYHFITSATYTLPFGKGHAFLNHGGWTDHAVGGWRTSGIWIEQSGLPLLLTVDATEPGYGTRPNYVIGTSPIIPGKRTNAQRVLEWFNRGAFSTPAAYTAGDVPRAYGGVRGPGVQNLDFSLAKFDSFERLQSEFRVDAFNITNNPHFAGPDGDFTDGTGFGAITSVRGTPPPRQLQLSIRILF